MNSQNSLGGIDLGQLGGELLNPDLLANADASIGLKDVIEQMSAHQTAIASPELEVSEVPSSSFTPTSPTNRNGIDLGASSLISGPTEFPPNVDAFTGAPETQAPINDDGFVLQYSFDNLSGASVIDASPNGISNNGTLRNGAVIQSSASFGGNVLYLEGGKDRLTLEDSADINLEKHAKRTLSLWFQADEFPEGNDKQVIYEEGGRYRGLNVYLEGGRLYVGGWNRKESGWDGTYLETDSIEAGAWHHVTIVLDADVDSRTLQAGALSAYLDGDKFGEGEGTQLWKHTNNIGVGGVNSKTRFHDGESTSNQLGFKGSIGELRLYNRLLDDNEIGVLATPRPVFDAPVPVLDGAAVHYRFEEQTGSQIKDLAISEGRQTAFLEDGATFQADESKLRGGVAFDGIAGHLRLRGNHEINLGEHPERSVALWFKASDLNTRNQKQVLYEEGGAVRGLNIYLEDGQLYVGGWNRKEGDWAGTYLSTAAPTNDEWQHVSIVLDADPELETVQDGAFKAYLNGELFGEGEGQQLWTHSNPVGIGAIRSKTRFHDGVEVGNGAAAFKGQIGDFQLYNRALDGDEIATLATLSEEEPNEPVEINLNLAVDTGANGTNDDLITANPAIVGAISGAAQLTQVLASFNEANDSALTDITDLVQANGQFNLSEADLVRILGAPLTDGSYTLTLRGLDRGNLLIDEAQLSFTLDRTAPDLELRSPLVDGVHSPESRLLGRASDLTSGLTLTQYQIDDGSLTTFITDDVGAFEAALEATDGAHQLSVEAVDLAGNTTQQQIDFTIDPTAFESGQGVEQGWGGKTETGLILSELNSAFTQTSLNVELGQALGARTVSFDVDALFDQSDADGVGDRLQVYLVDPANPTQTLLDQGVDGTPVFELTEKGANFQTGLVRFDGKTVDIDVTSLKDHTQGELRFQFLNLDSDTGSVVQVSNLQSVVTETGLERPVFPVERTVSPLGEELELTTFTTSTEVTAQLSQMQFESSTGIYKADLWVRNEGDPISRQVAVVLENIPDGVTIRNTSGQDSEGNFYLNLAPSISRGGLDRQAISNVVELEIENPNGLQFDWQVKILTGGANQAPIFEPIEIPDVMPGGVVKLPLVTTDLEGDAVTFSIRSDGELPTGVLGRNNVLEFRPKPEQVGSYTFTLVASDGRLETTQDVTLNVIPDTNTNTRVSGIIENVDQEPLVGVVIELGDLTAITDETGAFTIEASGDLPSDTLKIRGEGIAGDDVYPFIAEKLPLVLGHDVYDGVNNVIDRPIYLPVLDVASGQTIDSSQTVIVTTENIPGAAVTVNANSLFDQEGEAFSGILSITEVPTTLTPAALPNNIQPDLVVTIQPGEMVFQTPARLSLPNKSGFLPGDLMDLWSINPETGDFDKVGVGRVSADGSVIETVQGGIRNSSWHFFGPPSDVLNDPNGNPRNQDKKCDNCVAKDDLSSVVELHSGAVVETHDLVTYNAIGKTHGFSLTYDSLRADPRPIVNFSFDNVTYREKKLLLASISVKNGEFEYQNPGYPELNFFGGQSNGLYGTTGGEHFWSIPETGGNLGAALQVDIRDLPSGQYTYSLDRGFIQYVDPYNAVIRRNSVEGQFIHVNSLNSPFGKGWGLSDWQELVENSDGSILLIDGDGSELRFNPPIDNDGSTISFESPAGDYSTLEKLPDGSFIRTMKDQTIYRFNPQKKLVSVTDRNNNNTQYLYNDDDQLDKIIDPVGLETQFRYGTQFVNTIIDPVGRVTRLQHDDDGNLIKITDPDQTSRTWEYDSDHHIVSEIDKRGNRETTQYNFAGRAIGSVKKDGTTIQVDPLQTQGLRRIEETAHPVLAPLALTLVDTATSYVNSKGNVRKDTLDQLGQRVSSSDDEGPNSTIRRNNENLISSVSDSKEHQRSLTYDSRGNLTTVSEILPEVKTFHKITRSEALPGKVSRAGVLFPDLVDFGDINGDGKEDIITARATGQFTVSLGNGDGTFSLEPNTYEIFEDTFESLIVADFNNDGFADVITGTYTEEVDSPPLNARTTARVSRLRTQADNQYVLSVYLGDSSGSLNKTITQNLSAIPSSIDLADIDNDNDFDLIIRNEFNQLDGDSDNFEQVNLLRAVTTATPSSRSSAQSGITVLVNDNNQSLLNLSTQNIPNTIDQFALGDLNQDGKLDLVSYTNNDLFSPNPASTLTTWFGIGDGSFEKGRDYTLSTRLTTITLSDLNADGALELIVSGRIGRDSQLLVWLNDQEGVFNLSNTYDVKILPSINAPVRVFDANTDGIVDLVVAADASLSLFYGKGDGTFLPTKESKLDSGLYSSYFHDVTGDGFDDLIQMNSSIISTRKAIDGIRFEEPSIPETYIGGSETILANVVGDANPDLVIVRGFEFGQEDLAEISILEGQDNGEFIRKNLNGQFTKIPGSARLRAFSVEDIDNDGYADLYFSYKQINNQNRAQIFFGNGNGEFQEVFASSSPDQFSHTFIDINNDQLDDGIFLNPSETRIGISMNRNGREFEQFRTIDLGVSPLAITAGDTDNDGNVDLVVAQADNSIALLRGKGDGTFYTPIRYSIDGRPTTVELGDLNEDGYLDVVASHNARDSNYSIFYGSSKGFSPFSQSTLSGTSSSFKIADIDGDNHLDILSLNSSTISLFLGDGEGDFSDEQVFDLGQNRDSYISFGDIGLDNKLDLVIGGYLVFNADSSIFSVSTENLTTAESRFTYEGKFNQLTYQEDALGRRIRYGIDNDNGNVVSQTNIIGSQDIFGSGDDQTTFYSYTSRGLVDTITDPLGRVTDYDYDEFSRLVQTTFAKGSENEATLFFEYDAAGNQTLIIDENGNRTEFEYDVLNRLTKVIEADPDGNGPLTSPITQYSYDADGNTTSIIDARNHSSQLTYDELNRLTTVTDALGGVMTYEFDANGNTTSVFDELGRVNRYQYDSRNRRTSHQDPDGNLTRFEYDTNDNLLAIIDPLGNRTQFEYDERNRLLRETNALGDSKSYYYDLVDNLVRQIDENGNNTDFTYDELNRLVKARDALGQSITNEYDLADNLIATTDQLGRITQFNYDERDRLVSSLDPLRGISQLSYDDVGNLLTTTDELGRITTYEYDALNRQTASIDPLGFTIQRAYDGLDNLVQVTDALGESTSYDYDPLNRLVTVTNALGDSQQFVYDAVDNVIAQEDELGRRTTFEYDRRDLLVGTTDALDQTSFLTYDAVGNLVSTIDELGRTTSFEYDDLYRQSQITDAMGGTTLYRYEPNGNIRSITDELNRTTTYEYDALDRNVSISDPLQHQTTYEFDAVDNLIARTDALGRTTTFEFDALNRLTTATNPVGDTVQRTYDAADNVLTVEDELGRITTFGYDERDLQTSVTDPLGHTTSYGYDAVRNRISIIDALGHTTSYNYDELYRQINVTDAIGASTLFSYDAVGNLLSLTDPQLNTTRYTYDLLNRRVTDTNQLNGVRTYVYDAVDNEVEMTDRNGRVIQYEYDDLNRQTAENWLAGDDTIIRTLTSTYDAASQLIAISDPDSRYSYAYDLAGRLLSVDNAGTPGVPNVLLTYEYDDVNNMTSVTDTIDGVTRGIEQYTYDELDRVTELSQSGDGVADKAVSFEYDAASQMTEVLRLSSIEDRTVVALSGYSYDLAGRLTSLSHYRPSIFTVDTIAEYQWQYDDANRISQFSSNDGVSDYNYDDRDQLTGSEHSYQENEAYQYDENGNRVNTGYQTGLNNRLLSDGTYNYTYDAEGNRTQRINIASGVVEFYEWDYRNRLTSISTQDAAGNIIQTAEYAYDVHDRRILKTVDADGEGAGTPETERFVYDGDHISLVFDAEGNQTHRYFHGPQVDQVLAEETADGEVRWALTDNQGTIRDVIDNQGNVLNHITYDSFGQITSQTNATAFFRFGYTGREFDQESGQYYYRARYFDPSVGRFISEDTIGFGGGDANLYRYVFNSPLNYTDPSGNAAILLIPVLAGAGLLLLEHVIVPEPAFAPGLDFCGESEEDKKAREDLRTLVGLGLSVSPGIARGGLKLLGKGVGLVDDAIAGLGRKGLEMAPEWVPLGPSIGKNADKIIPKNAIPKALEELHEGAARSGTGRALDDIINQPFRSQGTGNPQEPFSSLPKGSINHRDVDLDSLAEAANQPLGKGGLTRGGRALDKHAANQRRPNSPFPKLSGDNLNKNRVAQEQVNEILTNPDTSFRKLGRGGIEARLPDGRGLRFDKDGSFSGFVD